MDKIIEKLDEAKRELASKDMFDEAIELKCFISKLKGEKPKEVTRMNNNRGQVNISSGNGTIECNQSVENFKW